MSKPVMGPFEAAAKNLGKSARTRARLLDAAASVLARYGDEGATVHEIAAAADVTTRTFYRHFKDREEIAAALAFQIGAQITRFIDGQMEHIDDAVERLNFGTRQAVHIFFNRPDWGHAIVEAIWVIPELRAQLSAHMRADLAHGVEQGAFTTHIDDATADLLATLTTTALFQRLKGLAGPEAGERAAELQLLALGVPADRVRSVISRPLVMLSMD